MESNIMETIVKLNNQTAGRDKLARLIQYFSRFLWYSLKKNEGNSSAVAKLKTLESTFSNFRKLLRLGKCIDVLYSTLRSIHYSDATVGFMTTLSKIALAIYLMADHILWVGRTGLKAVNTDKWSRVSNKYWLYSISLNLLRDFYEIMRILKGRSDRFFGDARIISHRTHSEEGSHIVALTDTVIMLCRDHKDVVVDTVKNTCDVLIPLTALGHVNLSPGLIGLLGTISSVAGIMSLVDPLAKLAPS